ncbi:MAG TPA: mycofactocin system GMC family oxidoreductase MftG [Pseudolysinimonas sp.]|nr:mycofactocin system GMC family oxidoreductase MftG [Pseudolysinimonas sp.]
MRERYDAIVIGAGAAGSPLAARLSEDAHRTVLVVDAGPLDHDPELRTADTLRGAHADHPRNEPFSAELRPGFPYGVPRGRTLGGSMAINGGIFLRATDEDLLAWSLVDPSWDPDECRRGFAALENDLDFGTEPGHGSTGPMPVSRPPQTDPTTRAFAEACRGLGFPELRDLNVETGPGWGPVPRNVAEGERWTSARAYLDPVRTRPNLDVVGSTRAIRVLCEGTRAVAVELDSGATVYANDIFLSAGSVATPQLLMVSGIGPRAALEPLGISPVLVKEGVGENVSDHPQVAVPWITSMPLPPAPLFASLLRTPDDIEILPMLAPLSAAMTVSIGADIGSHQELALLVGLQRADSRGTVTLLSADARVAPIVAYRYLESASDRERLRGGVGTALAILSSESFRAIARPAIAGDLTDDELDAWIAKHLGTAMHLCGTARFGDPDDPLSVVDGSGRVHGMDGLWVADTSILPVAPRGGTAATAVLIGERVAAAARR